MIEQEETVRLAMLSLNNSIAFKLAGYVMNEDEYIYLRSLSRYLSSHFELHAILNETAIERYNNEKGQIDKDYGEKDT